MGQRRYDMSLKNDRIGASRLVLMVATALTAPILIATQIGAASDSPLTQNRAAQIAQEKGSGGTTASEQEMKGRINTRRRTVRKPVTRKVMPRAGKVMPRAGTVKVTPRPGGKVNPRPKLLDW